MGLTFSEKGHRYTLDRKSVPSVSPISRISASCDGLIGWAAEVTAAYALDNPELMGQLSRQAYLDLVSTEARRSRDEAASAGVEVHRLAQLLLAGEEVQVPDYLVPMVRQTITLIERHDMHSLLSEVIVGSRAHQYGGRLDLICRLETVELGEHLALVDFKTGKSFWTDVALQLAGYRWAEFYVAADGSEQPMPEVAACYVAHIGQDSCELYPIAVTSDTWEAFKAARFLLPTLRTRRDEVVQPAVEHPPAYAQAVGEPL